MSHDTAFLQVWISIWVCHGGSIKECAGIVKDDQKMAISQADASQVVGSKM